ncbi:hypothetical protein B0H19DRAFT_1194063 [Mycena capillaripes]|nr:hypothetical protein B0H19DRAFT_1194063 [Mycena capillaripes]
MSSTMSPSASKHGRGANDVTLLLKDTNDRYVTISLPVEDCRSWQTFCNHLMTQEFQALSYIQAKQFVVRLEDDSKRLLSEDKWEQWISSFDPKLQPRVALCIIRNSCCKDPTENENGFCNKCGMQFLKDEPSYLATPGPADATTMSSSIPSQQMTLSAKSDPNEATTTSFAPLFVPSALNSVVRRRRFPSDEEHSYPSIRGDSHQQIDKLLSPGLPHF